MYVPPALVFFLLLQAHSPSVKPEKPVVQNRKAPNKAEHGTKGAPVVTPETAVSTPMSQPTTKQQQNDDQGETDKGAYRVKVVSHPLDWLYLIYVIVTAIAAFVAWRALIAIRIQGHWMKKQLAEMRIARKQTVTEMQAAGEQTRKLIAQAESTAKATRDSADALVASERAWIMLEAFPAGDSKPFKIPDGTTGIDARCECRNEGKTGAWINEIKCVLEFTTLQLPEKPNFDNVEPYHSVPRPIASRGNPETYIIQPGCIGDWGNRILILYGVVKYRDMFGQDRATTFGYTVSPIGEFKRITGYPEYNKNT
jgi:hypothetical protein